jgi:hypothetical protein
MKQIYWAVLLGMAVMTGCYKDVDETQVDETIENSVVVSYLRVLVQNTTGEPLADVQINLNGKTYATSSAGELVLTDVRIASDGSALSSRKEGYFTGVQRVLANQETLVVTMEAYGNPFRFDALSGWSDDISGEPLRISVPANAFEDQSGRLYNGQVNLYYQRLTRDMASFSKVLSPALAFSEQADQRKEIAPFGAFLIEAKAENGASLRLRANQSITLGLKSGQANWRPQSLLKLNEKHIWASAGEITDAGANTYLIQLTDLSTPWTLLSVNTVNFFNFEIGEQAYVLQDTLVRLTANSSFLMLAAANSGLLPNTLLFVNFAFPDNLQPGQAYSLNTQNFIWIEQSSGTPTLEIACGVSSTNICPVFLDLVILPFDETGRIEGIISGELPDGRDIHGNFYYNIP